MGFLTLNFTSDNAGGGEMNRPRSKKKVILTCCVLLAINGLTACEQLDHWRAKQALKCDSYQSVDSLKEKTLLAVRKQTAEKVQQTMNQTQQPINMATVDSYLQKIKLSVSDVRTEDGSSMQDNLACQARLTVEIPKQMLKDAEITRYLDGLSPLEMQAAQHDIMQNGNVFVRDEGYRVRMADNSRKVFATPFSDAELTPFLRDVVHAALLKEQKLIDAKEQGRLTAEQVAMLRQTDDEMQSVMIAIKKPNMPTASSAVVQSLDVDTTNDIEQNVSTQTTNVPAELLAHNSGNGHTQRPRNMPIKRDDQRTFEDRFADPKNVFAVDTNSDVVVNISKTAFNQRVVMHQTDDNTLPAKQRQALQQVRRDVAKINAKMNQAWKSTREVVRSEMRDYQIAWLRERQISCFERAEKVKNAQKEWVESRCHIEFSTARLKEMRQTIVEFEKLL